MPALTLFSALVATATISEGISPDRPGFADSASTVPKGRVQIEFGVRASSETGVNELAGPSVLLRVGLTNILEARVFAPDLVFTFPKGDGGVASGVRDMVFGLKVAGNTGALAVSAVPFISIPTGTVEQSSQGVDGGAGLNFEISATDSLQIGASAIGSFNGSDGEAPRVFNFGAGISVGFQFTESFGAFVESYLNYLEEDKIRPSVAGGVTYLLSPQFQLDLSGGAGIGDIAEGPYVTAGAAILL